MNADNIVGAEVFHKSLGGGRIVNTMENQYGTYLTVHFDNGEDATFVWSDVPDYFSSNSSKFNRFLQKQIEELENEQRRLKEEEERVKREKINSVKREKQEKIKKTVKSRNIQLLLHFTSVDNLKSILERGILSRAEMQKQGISAAKNDEMRLDFCPDGISCSVTLPNAGLLFKFQKENNRKYVLLEIKPDVLWEKECLFCKENAASRKVYLTPHNSMPEALEGMFGDYDDGHTRKELENLYMDGFIEDNMPTHNQAEVLVKQKIEPEYITGVYVFREDCSESFVSHVKEIITKYPRSVYYCPDDFMRRCKQPEKGFWGNTKRYYNEVPSGIFDDEFPF